jgi:hypothetical protein
LQYIIELAVSGQQDGWRDPMATSEDRLNRLRKHRSAWKNMTWSREVKIPMNDGGLWALSGGVLSYENQKGELAFHQLPSDIRGIDEKTWTLGPDFGCTIEDFSMDPYQDLLVLVEPPQINGGGTGKLSLLICSQFRTNVQCFRPSIHRASAILDNGRGSSTCKR